MKVAQLCPTLWPHGLYIPWNSPGQNTGVGSLSFLQGIFPTQGSNPGLSHYRQILYQLSHQRSPLMCVCVCVCVWYACSMYNCIQKWNHTFGYCLITCLTHLITDKNDKLLFICVMRFGFFFSFKHIFIGLCIPNFCGRCIRIHLVYFKFFTII